MLDVVQKVKQNNTNNVTLYKTQKYYAKTATNEHSEDQQFIDEVFRKKITF